MLHVMVQANYTVIGYDTSSSDVVCWYACSLSALDLSIRACHLTRVAVLLEHQSLVGKLAICPARQDEC